MTEHHDAHARVAIRAGTRAIFERIVVPINGSPSSNAAQEIAVGLADAFGGTVRFVYVLDARFETEMFAWRGGHAEDVIDRIRNAAIGALEGANADAAALGVPSECAFLEGDVVEQLLIDAAKWKADVIVIGTHSRGHGMAPALGSKTAELLRRTTLPVLVVR